MFLVDLSSGNIAGTNNVYRFAKRFRLSLIKTLDWSVTKFGTFLQPYDDDDNFIRISIL